MSVKEKKSAPLHKDHALRTRRDFVSQGLVRGGAYALLPSSLMMAANRAIGAVDPSKCNPSGGGKKGPAFLAIDCAGGPNLLGSNFIVGLKGGQMDYLPAESYVSIGVPASAAPSAVKPNTDYGVALHANSGILAGLNQVITDPAIRAKINGVVACAQTNDDTASNPLNVNQLIAKIGPPPGLVGNIGTKASASGGRHAVAPSTLNPSYSPSVLVKPEDTLTLVDPGLFTAKEAEAIIKAAGKMSDKQLEMFQAQTLSNQIKELINCGYLSGSSFLTKFTPENLNARLDTRLAPIFPALATDANQARLATVCKLLMDGNATAGTFEVAGCDYHGQGVAAQRAKAIEIGTVIGRFLSSCAVANIQGICFITADGGVSSSGAGVDAAVGPFFAFSSDNGQRSGAIIMSYNPTARLDAVPGNQIGAYSLAGACDLTSSPLAGSPENLALWAVATYAGLLGKVPMLASLLGGTNPLSSLKDSGAAFGNITA